MDAMDIIDTVGHDRQTLSSTGCGSNWASPTQAFSIAKAPLVTQHSTRGQESLPFPLCSERTPNASVLPQYAACSSSFTAVLSNTCSNIRDYTWKDVKEVNRVTKCQPNDFYGILGLDRNCTFAQMKAAHLRLALALHPDKNGAPGADQAFIMITQAFRELSRQRQCQRDLFDQEWSGSGFRSTATEDSHRMPPYSHSKVASWGWELFISVLMLLSILLGLCSVVVGAILFIPVLIVLCICALAASLLRHLFALLIICLLPLIRFVLRYLMFPFASLFSWCTSGILSIQHIIARFRTRTWHEM